VRREHDHDGVEADALRPKAARLEEPDLGHTLRAVLTARRETLTPDGVLGLQRSAGNSAVSSTVIQRDTVYGPPYNDFEFKRLTMGLANDYLLSGEDFPATVRSREVVYWKTVSAWNEGDEDHFYIGPGGVERHFKVRTILGYSGPDTFEIRVIKWDAAGRAIIVRRLGGWINMTDGVPHAGERPSSPGDDSPHAPNYDDSASVPV
jgi:hypothetical protein